MPEDDVFAKAFECGAIQKDGGKLRLVREQCGKEFDAAPAVAPPHQLQCNGVGRDKDHDRALQFYFNRPVTDDEMRFLHEVMQRTAAVIRPGTDR